jgi:hypothetical protein
MHYVKQFSINGIDTKQTACIELQGRPNAATEGAVGALAMDMTSPSHDVYKCVAVNGSLYTWELLSSGTSIITAKISRDGAANMNFPYSDLIAPSNCLIKAEDVILVKAGDIIIDSKGYVYHITSIGTTECAAIYSGIRFDGNGGDRKLQRTGGKLQLATLAGDEVSAVDDLLPDDVTITRDTTSGCGSVRGIYTITNELLRIFRGTQAQYNKLTDSQKENVHPIITDDPTKANVAGLLDGSVSAAKAIRLAVPSEGEWITGEVLQGNKSFKLMDRLAEGVYLLVVGMEDGVITTTSCSLCHYLQFVPNPRVYIDGHKFSVGDVFVTSDSVNIKTVMAYKIM